MSEHPSRRVAAILRRKIEESCIYEPGEQLPSERELAADYGISVNTAREVFRILQVEGLAEAGAGGRMFVKEQPVGGTTPEEVAKNVLLVRAIEKWDELEGVTAVSVYPDFAAEEIVKALRSAGYLT